MIWRVGNGPDSKLVIECESFASRRAWTTKQSSAHREYSGQHLGRRSAFKRSASTVCWSCIFERAAEKRSASVMALTSFGLSRRSCRKLGRMQSESSNQSVELPATRRMLTLLYD